MNYQQLLFICGCSLGFLLGMAFTLLVRLTVAPPEDKLRRLVRKQTRLHQQCNRAMAAMLKGVAK